MILVCIACHISIIIYIHKLLHDIMNTYVLTDHIITIIIGVDTWPFWDTDDLLQYYYDNIRVKLTPVASCQDFLFWGEQYDQVYWYIKESLGTNSMVPLQPGLYWILISTEAKRHLDEMKRRITVKHLRQKSLPLNGLAANADLPLPGTIQSSTFFVIIRTFVETSSSLVSIKYAWMIDVLVHQLFVNYKVTSTLLQLVVQK